MCRRTLGPSHVGKGPRTSFHHGFLNMFVAARENVSNDKSLIVAGYRIRSNPFVHLRESWGGLVCLGRRTETGNR